MPTLVLRVSRERGNVRRIAALGPSVSVVSPGETNEFASPAAGIIAALGLPMMTFDALLASIPLAELESLDREMTAVVGERPAALVAGRLRPPAET